MHIKMKFIVAVALLVIQLTAARAQEKPDNDTPRRGRANNIIYDIESQDFPNALIKMERIMADYQKITNYVIHNVYRNNEGNLDLILDFVNSNDNVTSVLAILKSLDYELVHNSHDSYVGRLKVMKMFHDKIPDENLLSESDLINYKKLKIALTDLARNSTAEVLKVAMRTNDSEAISMISENVHNYQATLYKGAIRQALHEGYDRISKTYLLEFFANHKNPSQRVYFYSALQYAFAKRADKLSSPLWVNLAFDLKKLLDEGSVTDDDARSTAKDVTTHMPKSVHNLAFSSKVCIVSTYYQKHGSPDSYEYLYASSNLKSESRRQVYTWTDGGRVKNGYWIIERHEDKFYIKNKFYIKDQNKYREEYLYAFYQSEEEEKRDVLTWGEGYPDHPQFDWTFYPLGQDVYIKNPEYNEFLYGYDDDNTRHDIHRRDVFTKSKKDWDSLWTIEDCSRYPW